jgi:hypothetical protein
VAFIHSTCSRRCLSRVGRCFALGGEQRLFGGHRRFQLGGFLLPLGHDQIVHLHAGDLVQAHHHRLAAPVFDHAPALVKVVNKVLRHLVQSRG